MVKTFLIFLLFGSFCFGQAFTFTDHAWLGLLAGVPSGGTPPVAGLLGQWAYQEGSGTTTADLSGNGNTGTLENGAEMTSGSIGDVAFGAVYFNKANSEYILTKSGAGIASSRGDWTISTWVLTTDSGSKAYYCERGTSGNDIIKLEGDTHGLLTYRNDAGNLTQPSGSTSFIDSAWHLFTVTFTNSTGFTVYEDGVAENSQSWANSVSQTDGSMQVRIGNDAQDGSTYLLGCEADTRVYDHGLTAAEVAALFAAKPAPITLPAVPTNYMVGEWQFLEGTGAATSNTVNNATYMGSLVNGPTWGTGRIGTDVFPAMLFKSSLQTHIVLNTGAIVGGNSHFTISTWIKSTASSGSGVVFYCERGSSGNDILKINAFSSSSSGPNQILHTYRNDSGTIISDHGFRIANDGNWHLASIVFDGAKMRIYTDGTLDEEETWTGSDNNFTDGSLETWLGGDKGDSGIYLDGLLADVRCYTTNLSQLQEMALYQAKPQALPSATAPTPDFWVPMNEGTGSTANESIHSYSASIQGTAAWGTGRKGGSDHALIFDGSSTYVVFPSASEINNWTDQSFCVWVKQTGSTVQYSRIVEKGSDSEWTFHCHFNNDGHPAISILGSNALLFESATSINDGNWHFLAVTMDSSGSGTVTLYVDGNATDSATCSTPGTKTGVITIGTNGGHSGSYFWNGLQEDLKIYNHVLSRAEIVAIMNQ